MPGQVTHDEDVYKEAHGGQEDAQEVNPLDSLDEAHWGSHWLLEAAL